MTKKKIGWESQATEISYVIFDIKEPLPPIKSEKDIKYFLLEKLGVVCDSIKKPRHKRFIYLMEFKQDVTPEQVDEIAKQKKLKPLKVDALYLLQTNEVWCKRLKHVSTNNIFLSMEEVAHTCCRGKVVCFVTFNGKVVSLLPKKECPTISKKTTILFES